MEASQSIAPCGFTVFPGLDIQRGTFPSTPVYAAEKHLFNAINLFGP